MNNYGVRLCPKDLKSPLIIHFSSFIKKDRTQCSLPDYINFLSWTSLLLIRLKSVSKKEALEIINKDFGLNIDNSNKSYNKSKKANQQKNKKVLKEIGYENEFEIVKVISEQSPDINQAVVKEELCANDQGIVYGYATNDEIDERNIEKVYQLADDRMYECKKLLKNGRERRF